MMQRDCRHDISYDVSHSCVCSNCDHTHSLLGQSQGKSFKFMEKPCNALYVVDVQKHKNDIIYIISNAGNHWQRGGRDITIGSLGWGQVPWLLWSEGQIHSDFRSSFHSFMHPHFSVKKLCFHKAYKELIWIGILVSYHCYLLFILHIQGNKSITWFNLSYNSILKYGHLRIMAVIMHVCWLPYWVGDDH